MEFGLIAAPAAAAMANSKDSKDRMQRNKKLSYRRETACQLHTSFSVHSLIMHFTEHRICFYSASAERCISYDRFCPTVWPPDRPSHAGIMPKRLQLRSCGLHWRI